MHQVYQFDYCIICVIKLGFDFTIEYSNNHSIHCANKYIKLNNINKYKNTAPITNTFTDL